jgi:SAM-dependent methyltransferase
MRQTLHARLDVDLASQGLQAVRGKFSLIIMPQTMQYMPDPRFSAKVLIDLLKPGGYLLFSSPFVQVVSEANQLLQHSAHVQAHRNLHFT